MRILVVSSYLPFPLHSGGHVRLFNLIKQLSKRHKITLICEKRDLQTQADIHEVGKFCEEIVTVPRKKQWSMKNIFKAGFSSYPFLLVGHTSLEMKQQIVKVLNEKKFDVIHVETFYVNQNLPKTYLPVVLVEHNIEYEVYQRFVNTSSSYLRPILKFDVFKIKQWEKHFWKKATKLIAVSEKEKETMGREDVVVIPNGVDLASFPFKRKRTDIKTKRILFIGDFKWIQNLRSAKMILEDIWPHIKNKENLQLWIVGKNIPENFKSLRSKNIIFDENAPEETAKIYQKADILLAPIIVGGGTSYKILESMASGTPVVTTKLGVEGLGALDKKHALVGQTAAELSKCIADLLSKKDLYDKIARDARELIEQKYSWDKIAHSLEIVYGSVI